MSDLSKALRGMQLPPGYNARVLADAADEIDRLTASLKRANETAEHFERHWYLRGDEIERLTAERDDARAERDAMAKQAEPFRRLVDACKLLSSESEEFESDDGIGRFVALDYWHEFDDKLDAAINAQLEKEHSE